MSLLLAAVLLTLLGNLQRLGWLPRNAAGFQSLNLARLQHVPGSTVHVVAVGSSKTFYAIEFDQQFAKRLNALGEKVAFTRISTSSPTIADIDVALDALLQAPPDVLLLESDLLLIDRKYRGDRHTWSDRMRINLRLLGPPALDTLFIAQRQNHGEIDWPSSSACRAAKSAAKLQKYASKAKRWSAASPAHQADYLVFLRALELAGTRVVLLELPRSPLAEIAVPAIFKQQTAQLRERLLEQEGFLAWTPGAIAESLYCDQGHLNQQGRELYSDWLARQLMALLVRTDA